MMIACLALMVWLGCGKAEEKPAVDTAATETAVAAPLADHVPTADEIGREAVCPVCKMTITVNSGTPAATYQQKVYFFCAAEEKTTFASAPDKYLTTPEDASQGQ